tara:strand:+ start:75 stop:338 length:264 start_codon:yes stop_codon:yes gene_type:complete
LVGSVVLALALYWQQIRQFPWFAKAVGIRGEWVAKISQWRWHKGECLPEPGVRRNLVPCLPANLRSRFIRRIVGGSFTQGASARACA